MNNLETTKLTEAELDEMLGKPGLPIEIDPKQLAAAVALQRAEAKNQTTIDNSIWNKDPNTWTDAERAIYIANDVEMHGLADVASNLDPGEQALILKALRQFALTERANAR